jgi:undecaprenyl-phosphate 4-deoxy-4-formamido-L-arabinose transferase
MIVSKIDLDVVIPLYNSKKTLPRLIDRLNQWSSTTELSFNVIFIEDGDAISSKSILEECTTNFSFRFLRLTKNYGQHTATAIGLGYCKANLIATIDDDLQHDPFEIEKLITCLRETGADLVYGTFGTKEHSFFRNAGSQVLKLIFSYEKVDYSSITAFRVMRLKVAASFKNNQKPIVFIEEYLLRNSTKKSTCLVNHAKREGEASSYSFWSLFKFALKIIVFHSSFLLNFIIRFGIFTAVTCFIIGCYFIYKKVVFDSYEGFSALIVSIFFSTGILLMTLGVIGEYVRRIWISQNKLDQVIIAEDEQL